MYQNDEEHRNKASQWSDKLKDINPEVMHIILKEVSLLREEMEQIAMKPEKTEADTSMLVETREKIEDVLYQIDKAKEISNQTMVHHAITIYEHFQKLAASGSDTALEVVKLLEPDYLRLLDQMADKN